MTDENYIRVNGQDVRIQHADDWGPMRLSGEWGGEQCEGCGADICTTGFVDLRRCVVRCSECDASYVIEVK